RHRQPGTDQRGHAHNDHPYRVVGILKPTNTVLDQLIVTNLATIWQVHGQEADHHHDDDTDAHKHDEHAEHDEHGEHGEDHAHDHDETDGEYHHDDDAHKKDTPTAAADEPMATSPFMVVRKAGQPPTKIPNKTAASPAPPEITAALLKFRSPMGTLMMPRIINQTTNMQAAVPTLEMNRLLNLMGIGIKTIQGIAAAIMLVSGLSVFIALYNRLRQRRYEHALIRSMGGSRSTLLWLTLAEGWALALAGFGLGLLLSRLGLALLNAYSGKNFHLHFSYQPIAAEAALLGITLAVGTLAALLPAIKAFRLNISQTLAQG
ncbi:MAG: FtsX-like permease family protein, partial [Bacteroidetes bacterium]